MKLNVFIQSEILRLREMKERYAEVARGLPPGRLSFVQKKGRRYYRWIDGDTSKKLDEDSEIIFKIQQRYFAERIVKKADQNIHILDKALNRLCAADPLEVFAELPAAYRNLRILSEENGPFTDIDSWLNEPVERNTLHPEHLIHQTERGDYVRSKGEALIANMLHNRHIPYRYEEVIHTEHGTISPDFSVAVKSENRVRYWEHCGMVSNYEYFRRYCEKQWIYLNSGLMINRDVIFTYEDARGSIDTKAIAKTIELYFR